MGFLKLNVESSGGGGRFGVSGTGRGFAAGGGRRRGVSFGSRSRRSEIAPAGRSFKVLPVLDGIIDSVVVVRGCCQNDASLLKLTWKQRGARMFRF